MIRCFMQYTNRHASLCRTDNIRAVNYTKSREESRQDATGLNLLPSLGRSFGAFPVFGIVTKPVRAGEKSCVQIRFALVTKTAIEPTRELLIAIAKQIARRGGIRETVHGHPSFCLGSEQHPPVPLPRARARSRSFVTDCPSSGNSFTSLSPKHPAPANAFSTYKSIVRRRRAPVRPSSLSRTAQSRTTVAGRTGVGSHVNHVCHTRGATLTGGKKREGK